MGVNPNEGLVSRKIRWLAILAGCSSAVFGAAFGSFLTLGAIIQPSARTAGRWLIWLGALLLSLVVVPFGPGVVFEQARLLSRGGNVGILLLFIVSTVLVYWCDAAIVLEAVKSRRNQWVRGGLDWLVWIAAIGLSAWCAWFAASMVYAYRANGRFDVLLTTVGFGAVILFFDLALIVHAVRTRRTA